jgi:hypothetical protein
VPAAAVIPAPIAYINVVAVKKLVVGFLTFELLTGPELRLCVFVSVEWFMSFYTSGDQVGCFTVLSLLDSDHLL